MRWIPVVLVLLATLLPIASVDADMPYTDVVFEHDYTISGTIRPGFGDDGDNLTDGIATEGDYNDGTWVVWDNDDPVITLNTQPLPFGFRYSKVAVHLISRTGFGIAFPTAITVAVSNDGSSFTQVASESLSLTDGNPSRAWATATFRGSESSLKFVRVTLTHSGTNDVGVNEVTLERTVEGTLSNMEEDFTPARLTTLWNASGAIYGMTYNGTDGRVYTTQRNPDVLAWYDADSRLFVNSTPLRGDPSGAVFTNSGAFFWYYSGADNLLVRLNTTDWSEDTTHTPDAAIGAVNEDGLEHHSNSSSLIVVDDASDEVHFIGETNGTTWQNISIEPESEGITRQGGRYWILYELPDTIMRYEDTFTDAPDYAMPPAFSRNTAVAWNGDRSILYTTGESTSSGQVAELDASSLDHGVFNVVGGRFGRGIKNGTGASFDILDGNPPTGARDILVHGNGNALGDDFALLKGVFTGDFDLRFSANIEDWAGTDDLGFVFGYQDEDNYNFLRLDDTNDRLWYGRVINGSALERFETGFSITSEQVTDYRVTQSGSTVTVYTPDDIVTVFFSYTLTGPLFDTSSPWTQGFVGFGHTVGGYEVDNITFSHLSLSGLAGITPDHSNLFMRNGSSSLSTCNEANRQLGASESTETEIALLFGVEYCWETPAFDSRQPSSPAGEWILAVRLRSVEPHSNDTYLRIRVRLLDTAGAVVETVMERQMSGPFSNVAGTGPGLYVVSVPLTEHDIAGNRVQVLLTRLGVGGVVVTVGGGSSGSRVVAPIPPLVVDAPANEKEQFYRYFVLMMFVSFLVFALVGGYRINRWKGL